MSRQPRAAASTGPPTGRPRRVLRLRHPLKADTTGEAYARAGPIRGVLSSPVPCTSRTADTPQSGRDNPEVLFTAAIVVGACPFSRQVSSVPMVSNDQDRRRRGSGPCQAP